MSPPTSPADRPELALSPLLNKLRPMLASAPHPVYLVGGAVRDACLGITAHDLDFAVAEGAIALAFKVADALGWPAYRLDEERDIGRVMVPDGAASLDFARFRGESLADDLRARDFTVNALALPATAVDRANIVDPCGGLADLAAGHLQPTSPRALRDDPVRALRAIRLAAQLGFTLTAGTRAAITAAAPHLAEVSPERNRDELSKLLLVEEPGPAVAALAEMGLRGTLFASPAAGGEAMALNTALLDAVVTVERTAGPGSPLASHLERPLDGDVNGRLLLRLAALWSGLAPPAAAAAAATKSLSDLRFSKEARRHVGLVVHAWQRPETLAGLPGDGAVARRGVFRYYRDLGLAGVDAALLALARHRIHPQPALAAVAERLLTDYWHHYDSRIAPRPLADGHQIMAWLDLQPGPEIGRLLASLQEAQAVGEVRSREEAEAFVREESKWVIE